MTNAARTRAAGILTLAAILIFGVSCARSRDAGQREGPVPRPRDYAGFLVLDCKADDGVVILGGGTETVEVVYGEPPTRVPAGSYVPILCVLESEDADGVKWRASSSAGQPGAPVVVERGETARLVCGAPFTARLTHVKKGSTIVFRVAMTGQAGLSYSPSSIGQGGAAVPPPGIVVRDADGKQIARGAFKYG